MMETCTRGFSYMAEEKVEVKDLQYIEGSELERTWRSSQRDRARQREQKIWEEFVSERDDDVANLCKDDPYQFLEQLPQEYLQELMERQLKKMQNEEIEATINLVEQLEDQEHAAAGDDLAPDPQPSVTFAEDGEDCDMFHIFDDENEDNDVSGPEDEVLNESLDTPCTVREREDEFDDQLTGVEPGSISTNTSSGFDKPTRSGKTEHVTSVIESSIYCAKVKDLRLKINEELMAIIGSTKSKSFVDMEREDLMKMKKRSSEFCTRFNRIHLYQLQRQLHDLKRHGAQWLPFAKHTQFQSQMVRVVALHQNTYQALQVFHKSLDQTSFLGDSTSVLQTLTQLMRESSEVCGAIASPQDLAAARSIYDDDILATCDVFDTALQEYSAKAAEVLGRYDTTPNNRPARPNQTKGVAGRKKLSAYAGKPALKSNAESKLSMYALDVKPSFRLNLHPKPTNENVHPSGTSVTSKQASKAAASGNTKNTEPTKSGRKTPRSRRPLMRAPAPAHPKQKRPARDTDIQTMVETVSACKSGHVSAESSPKRYDCLKSPKSYRSKEASPRPQPLTPRSPGLKESPRNTRMEKHSKNTKLTPIRNAKPLINFMRKDVDKAPGKATKQDIPEEPSDMEPDLDPAALGTIRIQTRMKSPRSSPRVAVERNSPRVNEELASTDCEVSRILKSLCGDTVGAGSKADRVIGAKNAQLVCVTSSARQASTPQLLRILEETIQKKSPRQLVGQKPLTPRQEARLRLAFNISQQAADSQFQYRTRFVQHMLASPMYANSAVGKPWEVIGSVSDKIIDGILLKIAKEMELEDIISEVYDKETC